MIDRFNRQIRLMVGSEVGGPGIWSHARKSLFQIWKSQIPTGKWLFLVYGALEHRVRLMFRGGHIVLRARMDALVVGNTMLIRWTPRPRDAGAVLYLMTR
jgi:hypothetical protein